MRYTYFYQEQFEPHIKKYDVFISGFDECERTLKVFDSVCSTHKYWLVFPQCEYVQKPIGSMFLYSEKKREDEYICEVMDKIQGISNKARICVDCTGILIPHLLYLIMHLQTIGILHFDVLYTSPHRYLHEENTMFISQIQAPRDVVGYECVSDMINGEEYLVMCAGFSEKMISSVAEAKDKVKEKHVLLGFPPLAADMYQQNWLSLDKSKEILGDQAVLYHKVSACDPFVSAEEIESIILKIFKGRTISAVNIAPLSTKVSALACALVYLYHPELPLRIIFPPADVVYSCQSKGVGKTQVYTMELPKYL